MASTPPSIAMGLRHTRRTLELIRETGEFTVNVPPTTMAAVVDYCGHRVSGRGADKFADDGSDSGRLPAVVAHAAHRRVPVQPRVPRDPRGAIGEYVTSHRRDRGDARGGAILDATGEKVDVTALDPLVYIAGSRSTAGFPPSSPTRSRWARRSASSRSRARRVVPDRVAPFRIRRAGPSDRPPWPRSSARRSRPRFPPTERTCRRCATPPTWWRRH